jgi:hypothetical protein
MTFVTLHNYLTLQLYSNIGFHGTPSGEKQGLRGHLQSLDWRIKNLIIFTASDFCASFTKVMFEARKLHIQMCDHDLELKRLAKSTYHAWAPMMLRDVLFRFIHLSFFYSTTDIEHKPKLMYSVPQIMEFMKQRRQYAKENGLPAESTHDLNHLFFEFHNYEVKCKMTTRITLLFVANAIATLVTNPFDVVLSKIATQHPQYVGT